MFSLGLVFWKYKPPGGAAGDETLASNHLELNLDLIFDLLFVCLGVVGKSNLKILKSWRVSISRKKYVKLCQFGSYISAHFTDPPCLPNQHKQVNQIMFWGLAQFLWESLLNRAVP